MATKKTKVIDGAVILGREALYGTVDDVKRLNVGGKLLVMRAKSTSTARQVINFIDLSAAPVVTKSIKTRIGRGVDGVELHGTSLLVGGYHGYSVVDLESGRAQSLQLDEQTWCAAFTLVGSKVYFAQVSIEASIPPGFYEHQVGGTAKALKKIGELPACSTEPKRRWARCDESKVMPFSLIHRGNEVVLFCDEGLVTFDARGELLTEKRRVVSKAAGWAYSKATPERFGAKHVVLALQRPVVQPEGNTHWPDRPVLVDLDTGATKAVFEADEDLVGVCCEGNRVYSASFDRAVIRAASVEGGVVRELPSASFAFAKPSARDAEYPFNSFWVTGNRVVVMNHVKSGVVFDGWPASSFSAS